MSDVKVLKLITGEEIISRLVGEPILKNGEYYFELDRPMMLQPIPPSAGGQLGFALVPWIISGNNQSISILRNHVVADDDARDQVSKNYLEAVTGIKL
jgi:hypothetical protein